MGALRTGPCEWERERLWEGEGDRLLAGTGGGAGAREGGCRTNVPPRRFGDVQILFGKAKHKTPGICVRFHLVNSI